MAGLLTVVIPEPMSAYRCKAVVVATCERSYLILYLATNEAPSSDTCS